MKSLVGLIGLCARQIGMKTCLVSVLMRVNSAVMSFIKSWKLAIGIVRTSISCLDSTKIKLNYKRGLTFALSAFLN